MFLPLLRTNAVIIEGVDVSIAEESIENMFPCNSSVDIYEPRLLRVNKTINKKFIVLLHPRLERSTITPVLESMQCYFGNISFTYINFPENTLEKDICDSFKALSNREARAVHPLVIVFPKVKRPDKTPCIHFNTNGTTIQISLEGNSARVFIRSKVADFVMESCSNNKVLFDTMGAVINPYMHSNLVSFPYHPLPPEEQKVKFDARTWHAAAVVGIILAFILLLSGIAYIAYRKVKATQKERDRDRRLRKALMEGKALEDVLKTT